MRHCCSWRECGLDAVERVCLRLLPFPSCIIACELAKGFSDGGIVPDKGAAYWRCRERNAAQSDFEVKPRLEAPYLSQGRGRGLHPRICKRRTRCLACWTRISSDWWWCRTREVCGAFGWVRRRDCSGFCHQGTMSSITFSCWKISAAELIPKVSLLYWYNPTCVENVVMYLHDGWSTSWWYPDFKSSLLKAVAPLRSAVSQLIDSWADVSRHQDGTCACILCEKFLISQHLRVIRKVLFTNRKYA